MGKCNERVRRSVAKGIAGEKGRANTAQRLAWLMTKTTTVSDQVIETTVLEAARHGHVRSLCRYYSVAMTGGLSLRRTRSGVFVWGHGN